MQRQQSVKWPSRCETIAAAVVTLTAVYLHIRYFTHAGALWRDEASSLRLANAASAREFWRFVVSDVFPALYFIVLRGWVHVAGSTDVALRAFGLLLGLGLLATIWWVGLRTAKRAPLWPLALVAVNPLSFQCGDQLRPYALAGIFILIAFLAVWRFMFVPKAAMGAAAFVAVTFVAAVQTSYSNSWLIFALATGSAAVLARRHRPHRAAVVLGCGAAAAISLLPYIMNFRETHAWLPLLPGRRTLSEVAEVFAAALREGHWTTLVVWQVLAAFSILIACLPPLRRWLCGRGRKRNDAVIVATSVGVLATGLTTLAFWLAQWQAFTRYFFLALCLDANCLHVVLTFCTRRAVVRLIAIGLALAVAFLQFRAADFETSQRITTIDRAAELVEQRATADDFVLLTGFYYGVSFQRYYHGAARWAGIPEVSQYDWYRWDLVRDKMMQSDPIGDSLSQIEWALRSGHKVFLVGSLVAPPATPPTAFPPAPHPRYGWKFDRYLRNWQEQIAWFLERNAEHGNLIPLNIDQPLSEFEDVSVFVVSGWRRDAAQ